MPDRGSSPSSRWRLHCRAAPTCPAKLQTRNPSPVRSPSCGATSRRHWRCATGAPRSAPRRALIPCVPSTFPPARLLRQLRGLPTATSHQIVMPNASDQAMSRRLKSSTFRAALSTLRASSTFCFQKVHARPGPLRQHAEALTKLSKRSCAWFLSCLSSCWSLAVRGLDHASSRRSSSRYSRSGYVEYPSPKCPAYQPFAGRHINLLLHGR